MKSHKTVKPRGSIKDTDNQDSTLSKRKHEILKKASQLSTQCGLEVFICICDKQKQEIWEFTSLEDFDSHLVSHLLKKDNEQQFILQSFTNDDFNNSKRHSSHQDLGDQPQIVSNKRDIKCASKLTKPLQSSEPYQFHMEDQVEKYVIPDPL